MKLDINFRCDPKDQKRIAFEICDIVDKYRRETKYKGYKTMTVIIEGCNQPTPHSKCRAKI